MHLNIYLSIILNFDMFIVTFLGFTKPLKPAQVLKWNKMHKYFSIHKQKYI